MSIKALRNTCLAISAAALLAATVGSAQTPGPTASKELFDELAGMDRMLFEAAFNPPTREIPGSQATGVDYRARREPVPGGPAAGHNS